LLRAFLLQPEAELINPDDLWIMLLSQFHAVADVVAVPMRAKHCVDLVEFLVLIRTHRVIHHPGINQDRLASRRLNVKGGMSQPGQLYTTQVDHSCSSVSSASMRPNRRRAKSDS